MLPALARRARLVLTVSDFARDELVALLGADPARIRVTPGGVDSTGSAVPACVAGSAAGRARAEAAVRPDRRYRVGAQERRGARAVRAASCASAGSSSSSPVPSADTCARPPPPVRRSGGSATSPSRCCRRCTPTPRRSCSPPATRVWDCRAWRRWRPARRSSRPGPARCPRRWGTRDCSPIPMRRRSSRRRSPRSSSDRSSEPAHRRRARAGGARGPGSAPPA